jgi:hypothetical protein
MKNLTTFIILFNLTICLFSIVPGYYGARSLSLGYSTTALNFDLNSIFINPALLTAAKQSCSGYQYQNSYIDYNNFIENIDDIAGYNLKDFESISASEQVALFSKLQDLFRSKSGIYGFSSSIPGFSSPGYGISVSLVKTAIINPAANGILSKDAGEITNDDIASLEMNLLGLSYKQFSFSYALPVSQGMNIGISFHYLKGKLTDFRSSIVDDRFSASSGAAVYLEDCWAGADEKFSKFIMDLGFSMNFGDYFNLGLTLRNIGKAKIETTEREISLNKRVTAGLAFIPNPSWGIYLDMDISRTDLFYSGNKMQPISIGIEKGFFKNKFFLRTGFLTDLTDKYFVGSKSNVLYGLGFGFNLGEFIIDFGLGVDGDGSVNNLAISGFFILK